MKNGRIHYLKSTEQEITEEKYLFECYPEYRKYRLREIKHKEAIEKTESRKFDDKVTQMAIAGLDPDFM